LFSQQTATTNFPPINKTWCYKDVRVFTAVKDKAETFLVSGSSSFLDVIHLALFKDTKIEQGF
jgi:hypothetical protein